MRDATDNHETAPSSVEVVELTAQELIRRSRWIGAAFTLFIIATYVAISAYTVQAGYQGLVVSTLTSALSALIWIGFAVAMFFGTRAVERHRRFCRACRYERATGPAGEEGSGSRCPECGAQWDLPKRTVRGRIAPRPIVIVIGATIIIASLGVRFVGPDLARVGLRLTPTSRLIVETSAKRGFNVDEWAALQTRTLTVEQKVALTDGLLTKRAERNGLVMDDATWIEDSLTREWLPDDLRERYYRETVAATLDGPQRERVGRSFDVTLRVIDRNSFINDPVASVVLGGWVIGDDPSSRSRANSATPSVTLAADRPPILTMTATEPGPLRISCTYWLVLQRAGDNAHFAVRWRADDTPELPDSALWIEQHTVDMTVQVDP